MKKIFLSFAIAISFLFADAKTFVLIHGQGGFGAAWGGVATALRSKGHRVITLDLPGHGGDKTDPKEITLATYCQRVIDSIRMLDGKVILVGHSMGGIVITKVTDMIPDRIESVVYLTAILPQNGQSVLDILGDSQSDLIAAFNPDTTLVTITSHDFVKAMCHDCPETVKTILAQPFPPSPARPLAEKVYFNKETLSSKPVYFICATEDRSLPYTTQKKMIEANGNVKKVFNLKMSHILPIVEVMPLVEILNGL